MGETLLVELLTEELPPKSLIKLSESFAASIFGILRSNNLLVESANFQHYETPRRLAVVVTNVLKLSKEKERKVKLVPKSIGFDRNGKPTKSLLKKMEALNLKTRLIDSIYSQRLGSVDMLFVNTKPAETPLDRCLSQGIELAIRNLPAPKLMTYQTDDGVTSVKFIRPVRGILAIHGSTSLQLNCLGLDSHDSTAGHRFLCKNRIVINNANEYEDKLEQEGKVIVVPISE